MAKVSHKFCGVCGTNLVLAREMERKRRAEELRKMLHALGVCQSCGSLSQHQAYCTQCGKKNTLRISDLFYIFIEDSQLMHQKDKLTPPDEYSFEKGFGFHS